MAVDQCIVCGGGLEPARVHHGHHGIYLGCFAVERCSMCGAQEWPLESAAAAEHAARASGIWDWDAAVETAVERSRGMDVQLSEAPSTSREEKVPQRDLNATWSTTVSATVSTVEAWETQAASTPREVGV